MTCFLLLNKMLSKFFGTCFLSTPACYLLITISSIDFSSEINRSKTDHEYHETIYKNRKSVLWRWHHRSWHSAIHLFGFSTGNSATFLAGDAALFNYCLYRWSSTSGSGMFCYPAKESKRNFAFIGRISFFVFYFFPMSLYIIRSAKPAISFRIMD